MPHLIRRLMLTGVAALLLVAPQAWAQKAPKVFMWRAVSPTATLYLLGTLHFGRPELYPLDRAITRAFDRSAVLVVEADVSPAQVTRLIPKVLVLMTYPPGEDLKSNVSAKTFKMLQAYCQKAGLDPGPYLGLKPWALAVVLPVMTMKKLGYSETRGLDVYLLKRAKAARKKVAALESALKQLKMLA
ncbi:MAG: TraB/GumN family protein, partial [Proteobacteria bacterium]|nr:TraB/GumN family protein [Pseudomonadota bacterium]